MEVRPLAYLFPDTKRPKNKVQDIVCRGRPGNFIQRPQRIVEIEQHHFVRNVDGDGIRRRVERYQRVADQLLMADVSQKSALDLRARLSTHMPQNCGS